MKKVYLVTVKEDGEHDVFFYIEGVFSTHEKAEKFLQAKGEYNAVITEMTVDDPLEDGWNPYPMISFVD